ncbi:MAG TPA: hypothetical protein VGM51_03970 [Armatimonadota bacterium]
MESHTEQGQVLASSVSEREAVCETPFSVAVMVTVCTALIVPAVAVNVAVEFDTGTETEDGTVNDLNLLLSAIATERLAAVAELSVIVQVPVAPEDSALGHMSDVSVTGGIRLIEAVLPPPFSVAVTRVA